MERVIGRTSARVSSRASASGVLGVSARVFPYILCFDDVGDDYFGFSFVSFYFVF